MFVCLFFYSFSRRVFQWSVCLFNAAGFCLCLWFVPILFAFFALVLSRINQGNKQLQFSCDFDYFILQLPFTQGNPSSKDVTGARHKLLCFFNIYLKEGITALVVFLRFETKRHIKCNKSSTKFISATR